MVADAFVQYVSDLYDGKFWTDSPIAIVPGTMIKSNINASSLQGQIMAEDLSNAVDDISQLITFEIQGSDLLKDLIC
ncbi:hypothetical protein QE152_g19795 [Popillia japonica]|uniref:Uncharacterized protein n=1 Tax=Popillia japonica TaxID=7064 RepID=A0AAW1KPJ0_POPJA